MGPGPVSGQHLTNDHPSPASLIQSQHSCLLSLLQKSYSESDSDALPGLPEHFELRVRTRGRREETVTSDHCGNVNCQPVVSQPEAAPMSEHLCTLHIASCN